MFSDGTQIDATNLPARLRSALARAGIRTADEVRNLSDVDLLSLPGVGRSSFRMLRKMLGPSLVKRCERSPRRVGQSVSSYLSRPQPGLHKGRFPPRHAYRNSGPVALSRRWRYRSEALALPASARAFRCPTKGVHL